MLGTLIWLCATAYLVLVTLTHLPAVQRFIADETESVLEKKLGTEVAVGSVNLGFLNRIIIDGILIKDQSGDSLLRVSRVSAKFDFIPALEGKISISSSQLFGAKFNLYRNNAESKTNFQFVIDSLASKNDDKESKPIDLHIGSLIIRNGQLRYNQRDKAIQKGVFSPHHINVNGISAHIVINTLTPRYTDINIKNFSAVEASGIDVRKLSLKLKAGDEKAVLSNFVLEMPESSLHIDNATAKYKKENGKIVKPTLFYNADIKDASIATNDLKTVLPALRDVNEVIHLSANVNGSSTEIRIKDFSAINGSRTSHIKADVYIFDIVKKAQWTANINSSIIALPELKKINEMAHGKLNVLERAGMINFKGYVGSTDGKLVSSGTIKTEAGETTYRLSKNDDNIKAVLSTQNLNIGTLTDNDKLGEMTASADINAVIRKDGYKNINAKGLIPAFAYNGYTYRNIKIDGNFINGLIKGNLDVNDPNADITLQGTVNTNRNTEAASITAEAKNINPYALNIIKKWNGSCFSFNATANVRGNSINTADGFINVNNLTLADSNGSNTLDSLHIKASSGNGKHHITMRSDFAEVDFHGQYDYSTISNSITKLIAHYLPTLPGLRKTTAPTDNNFTVDAVVSDTWWINKLAGTDIVLERPMHIKGEFNDRQSQVNMNISAPSVTYNGNHYENGTAQLRSLNDTLKVKAHLRTLDDEKKGFLLSLDADAADNKLAATLNFDNLRKKHVRGTISTSSQFFKNEDGLASAHVIFSNSDIMMGDTVWHIHPSDVVYCKDKIIVDHFNVSHDGQHINLNGIATKSLNDSLYVEMKDVDVAYILDMINFHSVDFSGKATGNIYLAGLFGRPEAAAKLRVNDFCFETGRMGTLLANVNWNNAKGQIDINATAQDEERNTKITGYVSPERNYIDLDIKADKTRAEFLRSFCGSFMDDINIYASGEMHIVGDLKRINLIGKMTADGTVKMKPLNVTYRLSNDVVRFLPNEIEFPADTVYDMHGNMGIVTGALHHQYIKNISYDVDVKAYNLLAYDTHSFGDGTFYGTAFTTGDCSIKGKSGEVTIDVTGVAEKGSVIVYNVSTPDLISDDSFIHWKNKSNSYSDAHHMEVEQMASPLVSQIISTDTLVTPLTPLNTDDDDDDDLPSNIHMNMAIDCNPDATFKLLMNDQSNDYITLHGTGKLYASWFNKGAFSLYGNYVVDNGTYNMSIQNAITRDFSFLKGGTIAFGGDPYEAAIDLKAQYLVNGVSLADLNIGRSFSSSNIAVNCIMNITGTPKSTKVDFSFDMPNVNNDAQQMITNLINSEEEMNQQVIYLLAIGRFYNPDGNNAAENAQKQSQTSLAMQSLLSGTISQQITNMLGSAFNISNWNFGANISTGTEGFNNAEYEGLLSGRMLNNRLIFNGQFGYRDNPNATTSFIGDFDMQYLLFPNGNLSVNVYNKTNDRYFTRNSLNTQGIGLKMQKDFSSLKDLFSRKKTVKKKKKKK